MTPTNEPSTEEQIGRVEFLMMQAQQEGFSAVHAPSYPVRARDIDAEITTLTDALTEARAENERVLRALLNRQFELAGRKVVTVHAIESQLQSILKDAP